MGTDSDRSQALRVILDELLEEAAKDGVPTFRAMVNAAGLDPSHDFVGASLRDMDFRDEDLRGFDFSKADLTGADFRRANVEGVAFRGAELKGAIGLPAAPESALATVLPRISANLLSGLIETLGEPSYNGMADLQTLADRLRLELNELFPVSEALLLLRFAEIEGRYIKLTDAGRQFVESGMNDRKKLFQRHLLAYVPLARHIRRVLQERPNRMAPRSRFLDELEDYMSAENAEGTLRAVTAWGRFAEIFAYDDDSGAFSLSDMRNSTDAT